NASSDEKGRFGYAYEIFEHTGSPSPDDPDMDDPAMENPGTEKPGTENMGLYRIINNQERNNQEKNNKAHSHQERAGAGGGAFSENDDGENETKDADAKGNDLRPMTAVPRPMTASAADAPDIRVSEHPLSGCAGRPMTNDQRPMTAVPRPMTASAADTPDIRVSAHPLSGCAGRLMTNDLRPMTSSSVSYALRQGIELSENNLKELEVFADKLGGEAVVWAVDEALASGKKFYAYVRGILNKRIALGAKNMTDIRSMEERRHAGSDKYLGRERPGNASSRFDCDITV
ncbi:MAG: hypothetical protein IKI24_02620, partial [Clostridia bacterium]|nr:hypothetical protein [Clostridia bacterium]